MMQFDFLTIAIFKFGKRVSTLHYLTFSVLQFNIN